MKNGFVDKGYENRIVQSGTVSCMVWFQKNNEGVMNNRLLTLSTPNSFSPNSKIPVNYRYPIVSKSNKRRCKAIQTASDNHC